MCLALLACVGGSQSCRSESYPVRWMIGDEMVSAGISYIRRTYLLPSMHIAYMELESRKVQKLGYSSLGVSLPKPWAKSNGIQPGSVVNMSIEDDGTLRVRVGPFEEYPTAAEATIDADSWTGPESLTRLITGNSLPGCHTIRVRSREEIS